MVVRVRAVPPASSTGREGIAEHLLGAIDLRIGGGAGPWTTQVLGLGIFAQGFEILLCRTPLRPGHWLAALVLCVVMAVSAHGTFSWP